MQLNSSKPIAGVLAMAFFIYLIYILLTSEPLERMNRICAPVTQWPARIIVSGARIFAPTHADSIQEHFDHGFYTCRRWVWGALYSREYEQAKHAESGSDPAPPSTSAAPRVVARPAHGKVHRATGNETVPVTVEVQ
jgi:hypothetical protein